MKLRETLLFKDIKKVKKVARAVKREVEKVRKEIIPTYEGVPKRKLKEARKFREAFEFFPKGKRKKGMFEL